MLDYKPFLIADYKTGKRLDREPWLLPQEAFKEFKNAHIRDGAIRKRNGSSLYGQFANGVQATRETYAFVDSNPDTITDSSNNFVNDGFVAGQKITVTGATNAGNNTSFTVSTVAAGTLTLAATDTVTAEAAGATVTIRQHVSTYPGNPIMGIFEHITGVGTSDIIALDTKRINKYSSANLVFEDPLSTDHFTGSDNQFFWGVNWYNCLLLTNNKDRIKVWSPAGSLKNMTNDLGSSNTLDTACIIIPFKDRLIALNTTESGTTYPRRMRWCKTGVSYTSGGGGDYLDSDPGLAIGTTKQNVATAAIDYYINGVYFSKAAVPAGTALSGDTVPDTKYGAWALDIGANGTIDIIPAADNVTGYASAAAAIADIPAVATDHIRLGTVDILNNGAVFIPGTTALDAATVTATYTDASYSQVDKFNIDWTNDGWADAPTAEAIVTASRFKDFIMVWFESSVRLIQYTGDPSLPYIWRDVNGKYGAASTKAISRYTEPEEIVQVLSKTALVYCDGTRVKRMDQQLPQFVIDTIDLSGIDYSYATFVDEQYQQWISYPTTAPSTKQLLAYNYRDDSFSIYTLNIHCFGTANLPGDLVWQNIEETWQDMDMAWNSTDIESGYPMVLGGSYDGYINRMDYSLSDNIAGTATDFTVDIQSAEWNPYIKEGLEARLGYIDILIEETKLGTLNYYLYVDNETTAYASGLIASDIGSVNEMRWIRIQSGASGFKHWLKFDGGASNSFVIHAIVPYFKPMGRLKFS